MRTLLRSTALVVGLALAPAVAGCAALRSSVDDVVRAASSTSDDEVRLLLTREADSLGSSSDEVAATWAPRFTSLRETYDGIDPAFRSVACDTATSWVTALLTPETDDDESIVATVVTAVSSLNASVAAKSMADDLTEAVTRYHDGEPVFLTVLAIKSAACLNAG